MQIKTALAETSAGDVLRFAIFKISLTMIGKYADLASLFIRPKARHMRCCFRQKE